MRLWVKPVIEYFYTKAVIFSVSWALQFAAKQVGGVFLNGSTEVYWALI